MRLAFWPVLLAVLLQPAPPAVSTRLQVPAGSACCPGENVLVNTGCLERSARRAEIDEPPSRRKHVQLHCSEGMYMLEPLADMLDFSLDNQNRLIIEDNPIVADMGKYCLADKIETNDSVDISTIDLKNVQKSQIALVCFPVQEDTFLTPVVSGTLALISVGFLILTLLVYAIVPELRDLQGKCIACTSLCLCLGFFHLSMAQLFIIRDDMFCVVNGFLIYFWMLGTFFWMNVVSVNVMKTVVFRTSGMSEKRTFIAYSVYGWGMPTAFLLGAVIAEHAPGNHIKPGFGDRSCWFSGEIETWGYFYGPVAILIVTNILLFVVTSIKLWKKTSYENVTKLRSMKYKFLMYLKIFLVMGISWIFEIISFVDNTKHVVWLIIDTFNCLQGLVFFLVLVLFRKRALRGLAERGLRLPCAPNAHTGPDEECDEIVGHEEEAPALTTIS